jgi:4-oxalocrotonate tautomerase
MPIVTIQITREGTTPGASATTIEQKEALYQGVTELLRSVLGKHPEDTFVILQEIEPEDWGRGGASVPAWRQRRAG